MRSTFWRRDRCRARCRARSPCSSPAYRWSMRRCSPVQARRCLRLPRCLASRRRCCCSGIFRVHETMMETLSARERPAVDPAAAIALLRRWLARVLTADAYAWLALEIERQQAGADERKLALDLE